MKSRKFQLLIIVLAILVGAGYWFWNNDAHERFPKLSSGSYFVQIEFGETPRSLVYIESYADREELFVLPLIENSLPRYVSTVGRGSSDDGTWTFPIVIALDLGTLKLTMADRFDNRYRGQAIELTNGIQGTWDLYPVIVEDGVFTSGSDRADLKLWMLLQQEYELSQKKLTDFSSTIPKQQEEIARLTDFVTNRESLKQKAEQKFKEARAEFQAERDKLIALQDEARQLEARISLAQRVTQMGKLVILSKESLDREGRWIEAALKDVQALSPEIEAAAARAEKLLALKKEIIDERSRIAAIQYPDAFPSPQVQNDEVVN